MPWGCWWCAPSGGFQQTAGCFRDAPTGHPWQGGRFLVGTARSWAPGGCWGEVSKLSPRAGPGLTLPLSRRGPLDGQRLKLWVSLQPPREGSVPTESNTLGPNWPDFCPHPHPAPGSPAWGRQLVGGAHWDLGACSSPAEGPQGPPSALEIGLQKAPFPQPRTPSMEHQHPET